MAKFIPRRERERQEHIRHILNVAEAIFARKGFFGATMRQIALKAEFALGTVYSYFRDKKGLYEEVIETKVNELVDVVTGEMTSAPSVRAQVERFIYAKMTFFLENLAFLRLYLADVDVPRLDAEYILPKKLREKYNSMVRTLTGTIEQGIRQGIFKSMNAKVLARTLDSLTNALALSWLRSQERGPIENDLRIVTEVFFNGAAIHRKPTQHYDNKKELDNEP